MTLGQYQLICGDSSNLDVIASGEAQLVLTSPPYFPESHRKYFSLPRKQQSDFAGISEVVRCFAAEQLPVFREIARVLRDGGVAVIQTKDLRYGEFLIPLVNLHTALLIKAGLHLVSKLYWQQLFPKGSHIPRVLGNPVVGAFRPWELEEFVIFAKPAGITASDTPVELHADELKEAVNPVWRLPGPGVNQRHPDQSPAGMIQRLIKLYTQPGDLVVDPYAGSGAILREAIRLGRNALGYEIDSERVAKAEAWLGSAEVLQAK